MASGTDKVGADVTWVSGLGTGTGVGGDFIIQTALAGGAGSSLNTAATRMTISGTDGNVTITGSLTTGTPTGGTSGAWKLGIYKTDGVGQAISATDYVELDIGGTLYKLALV